MPHSRRISVDLPLPLAPTMATEFALVDGEADILERDDAPVVETMADMIERDQGFRRRHGMIAH